VLQQVAGVIVRPGHTFDRVLRRRRWSGVLLLSTAIALLAGVWLMSTTVGQQALVDQWERTAAAVGHDVDDAGYSQLEAWSRYGAVYAVAGALLTVPVLAAAVAGLLYLAFGRTHPWTEAMVVAVHAGVVLSLRQVVVAALTYGRETTASALSVGGLMFPGLDAASTAARLLGFIDLFALWWVVVLAIGAARLYRRRARSTVLTFVGVYVAVAVLIAAIFTAAGTA
jgi:hypothetical protein